MSAAGGPYRSEAEGPGCARVRGRLERALDGGLEPLEAALDRGHLEACATCRAEAEAWRELLGSLRRAASAPRAESARVVEAVLARVPGDSTGPSPGPHAARTLASASRGGRWSLVAGAAALLVLLAWLGDGDRFASQVRVGVGAGVSGALEALPTWTEMSAGWQLLTRRLS